MLVSSIVYYLTSIVYCYAFNFFFTLSVGSPSQLVDAVDSSGSASVPGEGKGFLEPLDSSGNDETQEDFENLGASGESDADAEYVDDGKKKSNGQTKVSLSGEWTRSCLSIYCACSLPLYKSE